MSASNEDIGRRVREQRLREGTSQDELAASMTRNGFAWHQTTVAKTETGSRPLRAVELPMIALVLNCRPQDLMPVLADALVEAAAARAYAAGRQRERAALRTFLDTQESR